MDRSSNLTAIQVQLLTSKKREVLELAIKLCGVFILGFVLGFVSPAHKVLWVMLSIMCLLGVSLVAWMTVRKLNRLIEEVSSIE